jgi:hypothetical protein
VAVVELVDEHVDHRHGAAEVDVTRLAGHGHGLQVALVADRLHELDEMLARLAVGRVVDVGEVPVAEALQLRVQVDLVREVVVKRQRAHDTHDDALRLRRLGDPLALTQEHLGLGIPLERDVFRQDELTHRYVSPPSGIGVARESLVYAHHPEVNT